MSRTPHRAPRTIRLDIPAPKATIAAMIDWVTVGWYALQIFALALLLATASMAYWRAGEDGVRWREVMGRPGYMLAWLGALLVFSAAQVPVQDGWLQRLLWGALALAFAWETWGAWRRARS